MNIALPLRLPPLVVQTGRNQHGRIRRERFRFQALWGLHWYHYAGSLLVDGVELHFQPGELSLTPPGVSLEWRFPVLAEHHYVLFSFPPHDASSVVQAPILLRLPQVPEGAFSTSWETMISTLQGEPARASAWLWHMLWDLVAPSPMKPCSRGLRAAGVPGLPTGEVHPIVQSVLRFIDEELDRRLDLQSLAFRTGVSANHLLRLFRLATGTSVMAHVRARRAAKARELLITTSLPMRDIAQRIGLHDVHQFNKLMRRELGSAPTRVRDGGSDGS